MNHVIKFHSPDGPAFGTGEQWTAGKTNIVTIVGTRRYGPDKWDVDVEYQSLINERERHTKDAWNFQVRYRHVADLYVKG